MQERDSERRARETQPHLKQMDLHVLAVDDDLRLAPVDLGLRAGLVMLRHEHLTDHAKLTTTLTDIPADLTLRDRRAMLLDQALPDPPRGVLLLARRLPVSGEPLVDQLAIRTKLRRRAIHRRALHRRHWRRQRLPHRPPMDPMPGRQRPRGQPLAIAIAPDLLEQFHP